MLSFMLSRSRGLVEGIVSKSSSAKILMLMRARFKGCSRNPCSGGSAYSYGLLGPQHLGLPRPLWRGRCAWEQPAIPAAKHEDSPVCGISGILGCGGVRLRRYPNERTRCSSNKNLTWPHIHERALSKDHEKSAAQMRSHRKSAVQISHHAATRARVEVPDCGQR